MSRQYIDVFNGDADGLCALLQLRRDNPQPSELITGIKRDINLLRHIQDGAGKHITVLDISYEKNAADVQRLLEQGATIDYIDHHKTGKIIAHPSLNTRIDLSSNICTGLIVDQQLQGKYQAWAITAAFGDNLIARAQSLALDSDYTQAEIQQMQQLGIYLNYNGYGASVDDLFFHPADLYKRLKGFDTPFDFIAQDSATFNCLAVGYAEDMAKAEAVSVLYANQDITVIELPNETWARRVSGVWGNELANRFPDKAHAIISQANTENYLVSIRAPLNRKQGADILASQFPSGGGRKAAAGINQLPDGKLEDFIRAMKTQFAC